MKYIILFLINLSLFTPIKGTAHPGGHYPEGRPTAFATWKCRDGRVLTGNFSMFRNDSLFLEGTNGFLFAVPLHILAEKDRKLAETIIHRNERLNRRSVPPTDRAIQSPLPANIFYLFASFIPAWFLFAYVRKRYLQLYRIPVALGQVMYFIVVAVLLSYACKKESSTPGTGGSGGTVTIPRTSIGFLDSAFVAFKPSISTSSDNTYYYISSSGIPDHNMMIGITSWQQQVPIPQAYTGSNNWSIPLQPVYAASPLSTKSNFMKGAVAIAVNGIPIFNALNNRGEDSYAIGELDNWGGHCGRADDYHYHAAPLHLSALNGNKPIAFALDGFAVYGGKEADGSSMSALDTCHGHAIANGVYHYHGTTTYPYVVGAMRGKVSLDPATPAPENQILPQAFAKGARPATTPLRGATITAFAPVGSNGYLLTYILGSKIGTVKYSWDASNKFTYILTDTAGISTTATYQR